MSLKALLVHIALGRHAPARLDAAIGLARAHDAHLIGVYAIAHPRIPNYIRMQIGEDVLKICRPIVVDTVETALKEAGDLLPVLEKGRLNERQLVELGDVIIGRHPGRSTSTEFTLFESQGMAIQDIAVAVRLEAMAREKGMGVELPYGN